MELQIINEQKLRSGRYFEAAVGKIAASVWVSTTSDGLISVCCMNASHRTWKKLGRTFRTFDDAIAAYKSPQMKAIINAAKEA